MERKKLSLGLAGLQLKSRATQPRKHKGQETGSKERSDQEGGRSFLDQRDPRTISQLGEFVLREACKFAGESHLPWIAVNVSPVQFRSARLIEKVTGILEETGLRPDRLQLEITEGVLLDNPATAGSIIAALRSKGIRVALDDFGTGYSSMSYLRSYGVDKLKIDRSFIQELGISSDATAIVKAMVSLAQAMNMQVTAEGVETMDQRNQLSQIGCHELQGFLLSRPISAHQLEAMMQDDWKVSERGGNAFRRN